MCLSDGWKPIFLLPSQPPRFKVNGNHWTRHVKIFHPQFLSDYPSIVRHFKKFQFFQKTVNFWSPRDIFWFQQRIFRSTLWFFKTHKIMIFSLISPTHILTQNSAYSMKKDIEVTCGASKIDVRVNKNYFKEKRMDLRNIDQLTMSKNGTNCIPTYDRNTESYRFIIFAPFTMCNTQVVHETEGKSQIKFT